jgi:hypothetical protein
MHFVMMIVAIFLVDFSRVGIAILDKLKRLTDTCQPSMSLYQSRFV